jgi:hypothetical protein
VAGVPKSVKNQSGQRLNYYFSFSCAGEIRLLRRREPALRQAQPTVCVEDDRREDESKCPRSGAIVGVAQRTATTSVSGSSYEARHEAQRSTGAVGEPLADGTRHTVSFLTGRG